MIKAKWPVNVRKGAADWNAPVAALKQGECFEIKDTKPLPSGGQLQIWASGKKVDFRRKLSTPDRHLGLTHRDVCFSPKSGHVQCTRACPLWVISGHVQRKGHVRFAPKSGRNSGHRMSVKDRALLLCPVPSNVDLLRYGEGIVHINAEIPHSALYLSVTKQKPDGAQFPVSP